MIGAIRKPFLPNKVILRRTEESAEALAKLAPFTENQGSRDGKATAYVCQSFACQLPTTEVAKMMDGLKPRKKEAADQ